jgi:hypothetical protein
MANALNIMDQNLSRIHALLFAACVLSQGSKDVPSPSHLTYKITNCTTLEALLNTIAGNKPYLNAIHLSAAVRHLVTLNPPPAVAADAAAAIWELMRPLLPRAETRVMANTIWSAVKLELPVEGFKELYSSCFAGFRENVGSATAQELANVVYALSSSDMPLLQALLLEKGVLKELVKGLLVLVQQQQQVGGQEKGQERGGVQAVANTCWSVAKLGGLQVLPKDLLLQLHGVFVEKMLLHAKPQEVCNVLYAAALSEGLPVTPQQLEKLTRRVVACLGAAAPQAISSSVWAVASLHDSGRVQLRPQEAAAFVKACTEALGAKLRTCSCQDISLLLWASGTMGCVLSTQQLHLLLGAILDRCGQPQPHGPSPQTISNVCWAVAMMVGTNWRTQPLLQPPVMSLVSQFSGMLDQAKAQEVASLLWSASTMGFCPETVLRVWRPKGEELRQFNLLAVANSMWALARLGWEDEGLVTSVMKRAIEALREVKGQGLDGMQGSEHQQPELQKPVAKPQQQQQQPQAIPAASMRSSLSAGRPLSSSPQERKPSSSAAAAAAVAGAATASGAATSSGASDSLQECCNIAWAVSLLNMPSLALYLHPLASTCFAPGVVLHSLGYAQWFQVHIWLVDNELLEGGGLEDLGCSKEQLQQCRSEWMYNLTFAAPSYMQANVAGLLRRVPGIEVLGTEQLDQVDGLFSIDVVGKVAGILLAVEVDGPQHFLLPDMRLTGDTRYRQRALKKRGYVVVSIAGHDWRGLHGERQQVEFLRRKVQEGLKGAEVEMSGGRGVKGVVSEEVVPASSSSSLKKVIRCQESTSNNVMEGTDGSSSSINSSGDSNSSSGIHSSSSSSDINSDSSSDINSSSDSSRKGGTSSKSSKGVAAVTTRSSKEAAAGGSKSLAATRQQGSTLGTRPREEAMLVAKDQEDGEVCDSEVEGEKAVRAAAARAQQTRAAIRKAGWKAGRGLKISRG